MPEKERKEKYQNWFEKEANIGKTFWKKRRVKYIYSTNHIILHGPGSACHVLSENQRI